MLEQDSHLVQSEILAVLDAFLVVQQSQRQELESGCLKNLAKLREDRRRVFGPVQRSLDRVAKDERIRNDEHFWGQLKEKMALLMAGEEMLEQAVLEQRRQLGNQLGELRRGRKVVRGYGPREGAVQRPRFLSSRT